MRFFPSGNPSTAPGSSLSPGPPIGVVDEGGARQPPLTPHLVDSSPRSVHFRLETGPRRLPGAAARGAPGVRSATPGRHRESPAGDARTTYDHVVVSHDAVATDLTPQQHLELQFKASSSSDLIDDGLRTIRDGRLSATNRDQVLASLATGLGRLYALALDLHRLELERMPERPAPAASRDLGLADLHARLFDILGLHPERSGAAADQWLCRLSADPIAGTLVEALDAYRDAAASERTAPDGAWERVRAAVDLDPGVGSLRHRSQEDDRTDDEADATNTDRAPARAYRKAWNSRFISTIETIRSTIDACSQDGLLGGPAQSLGAELASRRQGTDAA